MGTVTNSSGENTENQTVFSENENSFQSPDPSVDPMIESHVKDFLNAINTSPGKPVEELSPADGRALLTYIQESIEVDISGVEISEKIIQVDGEDLILNVVRPAGVEGVLPVFIYIHGGGWVIGDFPTYKRLVRDLVVHSGAVAVFVNYSRSPEVRFPVAINQAYGATKWVAENGNEINVNSTKLAIVGNSVGGNMAAVVSMMAKDKNGPAINFQVLLWPVTDSRFTTDSYHQYAEKRFLTKKVMEYFWDSYIVDPAERNNIYASPLQATIEQLKGLPPTLIHIAQNDVVRDEGEAYGRKLDQAGVPVTVMRFNGMIHDFGMLSPMATTASVRSHVLQVGTELKNYLK